eukprot:3341741-Amphidinium_carterae.1
MDVVHVAIQAPRRNCTEGHPNSAKHFKGCAPCIVVWRCFKFDGLEDTSFGHAHTRSCHTAL